MLPVFNTSLGVQIPGVRRESEATQRNGPRLQDGLRRATVGSDWFKGLNHGLIMG